MTRKILSVFTVLIFGVGIYVASVLSPVQSIQAQEVSTKQEYLENDNDGANSTDPSEQKLDQSYQEVIDAYEAAINGESLKLRGGEINVNLLEYYLANDAVISYTLYDVDDDGVEDLLILADDLVIDLYSEAEGIAIQYLPMNEVQSASEIIILTNNRVIMNDTEDGEIGEFKVYDFQPDTFQLNQVGQYQYNFSEDLDQPVYDVNEEVNLTYDEFQEVMGYKDASVIDYSQLEIVEISGSDERGSDHKYAVKYDELPSKLSFGVNGLAHPPTIEFYPEDRSLHFKYPQSFNGVPGDGPTVYSVEYNLVDAQVIKVLPADLSRVPKDVTVNSELHLSSLVEGVNKDYLDEVVYLYYNKNGTISIAIPNKLEDGTNSGQYSEYEMLDES